MEWTLYKTSVWLVQRSGPQWAVHIRCTKGWVELLFDVDVYNKVSDKVYVDCFDSGTAGISGKRGRPPRQSHARLV